MSDRVANAQSPLRVDGSSGLVLGPDERHAAWSVGYSEGYAKGQMDASEDLARAWLHELAVEQAGLARANAAKKGPHWAAAIAEASEGAA